MWESRFRVMFIGAAGLSAACAAAWAAEKRFPSEAVFQAGERPPYESIRFVRFSLEQTGNAIGP